MKLAKCVFCGSFPHLSYGLEEMGQNEYYSITYVICTSCKTRGPVFSDIYFPDELDRNRLACKGWNKIHDRKDLCK